MSSSRYPQTLLLVAVVGCAHVAQALDDCLAIGPFPAMYQNCGGTKAVTLDPIDPTEPNPWGVPIARSYFFDFHVTQGTYCTFDTLGSPGDTVLAVFSIDPDAPWLYENLKLVAKNDNYRTSAHSVLSFDALLGHEYVVFVGNKSVGITTAQVNYSTWDVAVSSATNNARTISFVNQIPRVFSVYSNRTMIFYGSAPCVQVMDYPGVTYLVSGTTPHGYSFYRMF